METKQHAQTEATRRFWDRYIQHLSKQEVKETAKRWYVKRAEQYIKAYPGKRLVTHTPTDVTGYFERQGRKVGLKEWQFFQIIDAIHVLFLVADVPCTDQVDWAFWEASANTLDPDHATIAREHPQPETPFLKDRPKKSSLRGVEEKHRGLFEKLCTEIRMRGYSIRTEQAYRDWACRFIAFNDNQDPSVLGAAEVTAYLQHLVVRRNVAASTQGQALSALVFLYGQVLCHPLGELGTFARSKQPRRLPVVLSRKEIAALFAQLSGTQHLMAALLYGTGMRLMECLRLRVQDVDSQYNKHRHP
ncbi:Integron integrase IntIPac [hydrothermal vent metagenome]|uniref:Integron integrase IntIPac n=1 Tax=hydrothermal vent metagenome TaxID=652676 RepID=A0A3B1BA70_9ZZZZ